MTDNPISKQLILDILNTLRRYIAHYIKYMYIIENISEENKMERFAIDESLFTNINNSPLWVIGIINTSSKKLRLELSFKRNADVLKKIIFKHVHKGNIIVSDARSGYNWISNSQSVIFILFTTMAKGILALV